MATFVVGDLQGCIAPLIELLKQVNFNPHSDQLWLAGDLVNRGPESLATLRYLYDLDRQHHCIQLVLGNHDLHLLACALTDRAPKKSDTFNDILNASDKDVLINWLLAQPLFVHQHTIAMAHAGIHPQWDFDTAQKLNDEVCRVLQSDQAPEFFRQMYGNTPDYWHSELSGINRLRCITNIFTRMRYLDSDMRIDLDAKVSPDRLDANSQLKPWFELHKGLSGKLFFGHWASLQGHCEHPDIFALDTGFVWGGALTMVNADSMQFHRYQS